MQEQLPKQAQIKADKRRAQAAKALKMTEGLVRLVEEKIVLDWSPEQVSGWLKAELGIAISHERIYLCPAGTNMFGRISVMAARCTCT